MVILKKGSKGADVERLQLLLNTTIRPSPRLDIDGDFGERTETAVALFQKQRSLKRDGVVGPQTWTALGMKLSAAPAPVVAAAPAKPSAQECGDWMAIAKAEIGIHQDLLPGQDEPRIIEYFRTTTNNTTKDETAWCSAFVNWVMIQAGYRGTNSAWARSWLNWGRGLDTPQIGAITIVRNKNAGFDPKTGSPSGNHVAFLMGKKPGYVTLLGGNQGGDKKRQRASKVSISDFPLSAYQVEGYRWPS